MPGDHETAATEQVAAVERTMRVSARARRSVRSSMPDPEVPPLALLVEALVQVGDPPITLLAPGLGRAGGPPDPAPLPQPGPQP